MKVSTTGPDLCYASKGIQEKSWTINELTRYIRTLGYAND
jgi:hypothetical protein